ncbi:apolipoprotein N-acyltransferase [Nocardioides jishulii]|uniref:Apolipoprotein N-acyltransferase n=1 Tax=Nocardioides jishulii TaxID=2575440 RepID=A0A4U2YN15_9ACTN|nr:apolipoprotein N-acyltransferase [Nocardioides jishulii]QCX27563.1 apolipoprotein N-acyltransferase [Nocardioides jishulii]TKI62370.1 apolipoprotein N-acyltransferase [Nocardioides jishulii]
MLLRVLVALGAGAALAAASEPIGWSWLTPLCVAILMGTVWRVAPRRAWLPGLAFGIGFFFTLQWWMRAVGPDAWLGLSALEAAFFAPLGAALALVQNRTRWWPLWAAVLWVGVETLRSGWPFSGMPWGRLSYAVADTWWADALPWIGFTGVSLLLSLTGTTLAWVVLERPRLARVVPVALGLLVATVAPALAPWSGEQSGTATVAVVQGDVPGSGDDLVGVHREVTANHVNATELLAVDVRTGREPEPDFVLWPENSTAVDPFRDPSTLDGITRAADAIGAPILVGAMVDAPEDHQVLNQGIVWSPEVGAGDRYTKQNPVPFGEYIPWRDVVFRDNLGKLRQIGRDMLSGTRTTPLQVGGIKVADAICFDVAYDSGIHDQVREGGEMVTVQTSNAMFIHTHQIAQQYEITRLRALETGRYVAVAATNGLSGVIDPRGRPLAEAEPRTTSVLVQEVGLSTSVTPAVWMGQWPGRLALVGSLVVLLASTRRPSRMAYIHESQRPSPRSAE